MRIAILALILTSCGHVQTYVMPDGARCTVLDTSQGYEKFTGCNNGQTYVNPLSYSTVRN